MTDGAASGHFETGSNKGEPMACRAFLAIPAAGGSLFVSSGILMLFGGIVAEDLGTDRKLSYVESMVATIGLWLVIAPLVGAISRQSRVTVVRRD